MSRAVLFSVVVMTGCASADRIAPPPIVLPEDGAPVNFAEFAPTLRRLAWQANEAFYRDDWKELGDAARKLERAAQLLKRAENVPAAMQADFPGRCDALAAESGKLRSSALADPRSTDAIGGHLQAVHNVIRTIRTEG